MPLAGSESEIVKSLEWAVEEMSFPLCNFRVRLQYHPQSSYITTQQCQKNSESILTQYLQNTDNKNKQWNKQQQIKSQVFISDPLLTWFISAPVQENIYQLTLKRWILFKKQNTVDIEDMIIKLKEKWNSR